MGGRGGGGEGGENMVVLYFILLCDLRCLW